MSNLTNHHEPTEAERELAAKIYADLRVMCDGLQEANAWLSAAIAAARQSPAPVDAPPSRGVPVGVCEQVAQLIGRRAGEWSLDDQAKCRAFLRSLEAAKSGKVYVDRWPSLGVPVETALAMCEAVASARAVAPVGDWTQMLEADWRKIHDSAHDLQEAVKAARRGDQPPQVRGDDEAGAPKEVSPPPRTYSESDIQLAKAICDHVYRRSAGCNVAFTPIAEIISQFLASERAEAQKDMIGSAVGFSERIVSLERELAQARAELAALHDQTNRRIESAFREGWSHSPFASQSQNQAWWVSRAFAEIRQERAAAPADAPPAGPASGEKGGCSNER